MKQPAAYRDREVRALAAEARQVVLGTPTHVLDPGTWHVVGPFPSDDKDAGLSAEYPPEKAIDLRANYPGKSGPVAWQVVKADANGYVDLLPAVPDALNVVSYVYCEVISPADQETNVYLGTDDGARLWVNGAPVYANPRRRPALADEDAVTVKLRKGRNAVLLKIANADGRYGFYLRFESPQALEEVP
jgi:hypothetical protein